MKRGLLPASGAALALLAGTSGARSWDAWSLVLGGPVLAAPSGAEEPPETPEDSPYVVLYSVAEGKLVLSDKVTRSEKEWQEVLSPEQFRILRKKGTERAHSGALLKNRAKGTYKCAGCGADLFASDAKFESDTGWPSFYAPVAKQNIAVEIDMSYGVRRNEILCRRCGGHLGHVFDDGPRPTGFASASTRRASCSKSARSRPGLDHRKMRGIVMGAAVFLVAPAAALVLGASQPSAAARTLRYGLEAGDRLVYRQVLTREGEGPGPRSMVQAEWTSEVLVVASGPQGAVVGVQRRRRSAELLRAQGDEGKRFAERLAGRPEVVAAANVFDDRGQALLPLSVEREWPSDLLPFVQEIAVLPAEAVAPGQGWRGTDSLGLEFRAEASAEVGGEACLRLRGSLARDQVVLRLWFGAESRVLRRLELEGSYPVFGGEVREKLRLELVEHHRGERPDAWLDAAERREGVLAALLIADGLPVEPARLEALLAVQDARLQRAVLRLLWRRRLPAAPGVVAPLLESADPRVRALARHLSGGAGAHEARPVLEPSLSSVAAAVRGGGTVDGWRCDADPAWAQRALEEQRLPSVPPGARMRLMSSERWRGQPYVLLVPDAYRGDAPTPLLVYLSGGPGRALLGWTRSAEALSATGYLVAFPQASGMWWEDDSEELVRLLVDEILDRYNVDTNRVYLAGFSNGGTGTYFYAARWADRLAAAVSLEGAGPYVGFGLPLPAPGGVGRLPFLFVHGDRDEVIAVEHSRRSVETLKRENRDARAELQILPGRGHDVMLGTDDGLGVAFLERHRREPFPREVAFTLEDLRSPRRFWLEVLEKGRGEARVEGRIADDGNIHVKTKGVRRLRLLLRRELLPEMPELRVLVDGREAFRGSPREDCALLQRSWHAARDPFRAHSIEIPLEASR